MGGSASARWRMWMTWTNLDLEAGSTGAGRRIRAEQEGHDSVVPLREVQSRAKAEMLLAALTPN